MKKRFLLVPLALSSIFVLTGCGTSSKIFNQARENVKKVEDTIESTKENTKKDDSQSAKKISVGDTVKTRNFEFTLRKVELSYDVNPENPATFYLHYPAPSGKVYIHVDADIKNTQKQDLEADEIYKVEANYNNGYKYNGSAIVGKDNRSSFTYANITSIAPLDTLDVHNLVECPEEVETDTNSSLYIVIKMSDGSSYKYVIR